MVGQRKRKTSIVPTGGKGRGAVSAKATQATIAGYHTLLKRKVLLKKQIAGMEDGRGEEKGKERNKLEEELAKVEKEMAQLGGIEGYQYASTLGQSQQRGGDSSKVLIEWLKDLGYHKREGKLRMLEIGALKPDNYRSCTKWIENRPIDLHSQHPDIEEIDYMVFPTSSDPGGRFDVVSCSLVVNFVPDAAGRGGMLRKCRADLRPEPSSLLFMVLPLPCVTNSRYTTVESFRELMTDIGFELVRERWRPGGKVAYWLFRWRDIGESADHLLDLRPFFRKWGKKELRNEGPVRNNFAIVMERGDKDNRM